MMKNIFILFLLFNSINLLFAQQDTTFSVDEIENLFDEELLGTDDSQLYDLFENLINNPVDINNATLDELLAIPTIDKRIAQLLIDHRNEHGLFNSIYDINKISSFDEEDINKLLPFIKVDVPIGQARDKSFIKKIFSDASVSFRSRNITDLQNRKGFSENDFAGSKLKSYNRLRLKFGNNISVGALFEKDAGENSFADFNSYFLQFENVGFINKIIAGDYLIEFGEGLAVWSPYAFSKGSDAVSSLNKRARNITPYTSSDENQFFRGIASSVKLGESNLTFFYSKNCIDANIDTLTNQIVSMPLDGYHRTESELNKKNRAAETMHGVMIHYSFADFLKLGGLYYHSNFSSSISSSDIFDIHGSEFDFYSLTYTTYFENITMSGEFAYNGISVASINRMQINFNRDLAFCALVRNYPRNFSNLHSRGFGESGATQNEFGIYTGIRWKTSIGLFNIYYDQFKFPYATYYNPIPSAGNEYLINYEVKPINKTTFVFKYKRENKETAATINSENQLVDQIKQSIRFDVKYNASKSIQLRTRVELMYYDLESIIKGKGFLIFQDIKYQPVPHLKIYGRIVFFETDSYNSRIYEFENDLTGLMTNPALFGKGMKLYLLVNYKPTNSISISAKYSELYKPEERIFGTGLNEISGNIDNKISVQIDIFL